jgi:anionic cell wall polymer biosynthesis LytR-Cps2A-Psr (LCP) family protein
MLNKNLDLNITDYVTVDFNAVVECVDLLGGVVIPEVSDEEAVLMYGYMDEINKLTKHSSKYLSSGGTNVLMDGVQACAYARIRYTAGDDYRRTERQRTVLAAMVEKAQKSDIKTINSLINEVFGDIQTSFSNTDLISLATQIFNYSLGETTGFPFEKTSVKLGSKGSVVVPCDLESNVIQLHQFLYDDEDYEPSTTVKNNSAQIINDTGFHQGDGY